MFLSEDYDFLEQEGFIEPFREPTCFVCGDGLIDEPGEFCSTECIEEWEREQ